MFENPEAGSETMNRLQSATNEELTDHFELYIRRDQVVLCLEKVDFTKEVEEIKQESLKRMEISK